MAREAFQKRKYHLNDDVLFQEAEGLEDEEVYALYSDSQKVEAEEAEEDDNESDDGE